MVLLKKLPVHLETFGEVSDHMLKKITVSSKRDTFFVTDQYDIVSTKNLERRKRSSVGQIRIKPTKREQRKPKQFEKFLSNGCNKVDLVRFLIDDWSTNLDNVKIISETEI